MFKLIHNVVMAATLVTMFGCVRIVSEMDRKDVSDLALLAGNLIIGSYIVFSPDTNGAIALILGHLGV